MTMVPPYRRRARAPIARKVLQGKPPGTRARTMGSLERQADEAAVDARRGSTNASRGLTPAPPARYEAPASAGRPLPVALRAEVEASFGADLVAVRVHDDAAAHAAARTEEAEAFTAGRRIYFGQGRFDPGSADGRHLLHHEVAHVLQQTGRRLTTTLIQATEREGTGEIQKQAAPAADAPRFRAAARRHAEALLGPPTESLPAPGDDDDDDDDERSE
jgi:hypothetical protein